jgi:pimeloyl-ACP methyl ester carboxylesterase
VLVHGVGLSHRYLMPYAVRLAEHFRVFVPDQPGFGRSYKPRRVLTLPELADWMADWMAAVGLERAALMGNSQGCQVIVNLAVRHPQRVLRAVLQGPTVDPAAPTFLEQMWRWHVTRKFEPNSRRNPLFYPEYWQCGWFRLLRTFGYALEDRTEEKSPRMRCPTLVVRGALDRIVPQRWAEEVTRRLPRGRLIVLPGVPHTANSESPLELFRVTKPFFEEERRPPAPPASGPKAAEIEEALATLPEHPRPQTAVRTAAGWGSATHSTG